MQKKSLKYSFISRKIAKSLHLIYRSSFVWNLNDFAVILIDNIFFIRTIAAAIFYARF